MFLQKTLNRSVILALGLVALGLLSGCQRGSSIALTTVPTAHLAITLPATTATVGTPFTFTVTALDATNLVVPTYIGTVHIASSDTSALLPGDATLVRGVGTFTVTFGATGSETITASDTVGDASSGTSLAVSVNPIPVPSITSLSPTSAIAGAAFTLTVNGTNFVTGSVVRWNGGDRATLLVNGSQVTAQISATDTATLGAVVVTVFNPGPGGGTSNASTFTVSPAPSGTCGGLAGGPQSIAIDPTGRFAYVAMAYCTLANDGYVSMYAIDATAGTLTSIGQPVPTYDEGALSVAVDPAGKFAYVANWGAGDTAGSVSVYSINATTGTLTSTEAIDGLCGGGPPNIPGFPNPGVCGAWSVAVDPSGRFAYVANEGGPAPTDVSMFKIAANGALIPIGFVTLTAGGRASSVTVEAQGKFVYVTAGADGASAGEVSTFTVNASTGALTFAGSIAAGTQPVSVAVDPASKFAYVTNLSSNDVSMYSINSATGGLTSVGKVAAGTNPDSVTVEPAGKFAYVTNAASNNVSMYSINGTTGALTSIGTVATELFPTSIAVDPLGKFAYVTNSASNSVSIYSINAATGALTLIGTAPT